MRKIDIHVHIGKLMRNKPELSIHHLLDRMRKSGIEKACIMTIIRNYETDHSYDNDHTLKYAKTFPDKLIPFCSFNLNQLQNIDNELKQCVDAGFKGFGEIISRAKINDKRLKAIFKYCAKYKLPVTIHFDKFQYVDKHGLNAFEKVLNEFSDTIFIAHAFGWWKEISASVSKEMYPAGKIVKGGRVEQLLSKYDNIYADLSAYSGYNAIARDMEFGKYFLNEYHEKLLLGTDISYPGQNTGDLIGLLESFNLDNDKLANIFYNNAAKVLNL